ncbi:unnamed protein product (macronuclear) [Paramecium tetraurelia]|uniref:Costars domain-containing protein n=1 Tax=Paramecium tetraurelia TaxID=5888 RepID=A0DWV3_PARTE|nr:uncharacterized protein GSPATT00021163001 [Paramecium tetraurelia]CAK87520.1 unnamed protein product [Paramecium tetraurelia]|eukprot:XP_001454917.1 hypothetical protein (macronuclear) [Paramecium tetraurelia strain d4-2]
MQVINQDEIDNLRRDIQRLGTKNAEGKYVVKFGVLYKDERIQQYFEVFYVNIRTALVDTLKAAKKLNVLDFQDQMLLKGANDNAEIILK